MYFCRHNGLGLGGSNLNIGDWHGALYMFPDYKPTTSITAGIRFSAPKGIFADA